MNFDFHSRRIFAAIILLSLFCVVPPCLTKEWCHDAEGKEFYCKEFSKCNETTHSCSSCAIGHKGTDCRELYCNSTHTSYGRNSSGYCECMPGWGDIYCASCKEDSVCNDMHEGDTNYTCDQSMYTYKKKLFHCEFSDPTQRQMFMNAEGMIWCDHFNPDDPDEPADECFLGVYTYLDDFYDGYFYCNMNKCTQGIHRDSTGVVFVDIYCEKTTCEDFETHAMADWFRSMLEDVHQFSTFTCNNETGECELYQPDLSMTAFFDCVASECKPTNSSGPPIPPVVPPNYSSQIIAVSVVFGLGLVFVIGVIIWYCVEKKNDTRKYQKWKEIQEMDRFSFGFDRITYKLFIELTTIRNFLGPFLTNIMYFMLKFFFQQKTVIKQISGKVESGQMLAIIGASGAGKTTLLDLLCGKRKQGDCFGKLLWNEKTLPKNFKSYFGYVKQEDILPGRLTVEECIKFAANLKMPSKVPKMEKKNRIEKVMKDLEIEHLRKRKIGTAEKRGLSGGERRRVHIATEIISNPAILFLDEPTTGLDARSAEKVVKILRNLCEKENKIVIMSIHQPRSQIYHNFDQLLILNHGCLSYFGAASEAVDKLSKDYNDTPDENINPAEYLLSLVKEKNIVARSTHQIDVVTQIQSNKKNLEDFEIEKEKIPKLRHIRSYFFNSFFTQLYYIFQRTFKTFIRNPFLLPFHLVVDIVVGLFLGIVFFQLGMDDVAIFNRVGALFFLCVVISLSSLSSLSLLIKERELYITENSNGYYDAYSYFLAKITFDVILLRIIPPFVMAIITYFLIGFRLDSWSPVVWFVVLLVMFNVLCGVFCLVLSTLTKDGAKANLVAISMFTFWMLFGGYLINSEDETRKLTFFKFVSPFYYTLEALIINECLGRTFWWHIHIDSPGAIDKIPLTGRSVLANLSMRDDMFVADTLILFSIVICLFTIALISFKFIVKEVK